MDEARRMITEQYVSGKITREEFEEKKKLVEGVPEEKKVSSTNETNKKVVDITYQKCIKDGFILSVVFFLIVALYIFSRGGQLTGGGGAAFAILGIGLLFGIVFFTFIIFTPVMYVIKKLILPKLRET